jgi:hypothetical protein
MTGQVGASSHRGHPQTLLVDDWVLEFDIRGLFDH